MTWRGLLRTVIAIALIAAGAAIGWGIATATNPYANPQAAVATPASTVVANTPLPTFTPAFASTPGANPAGAAGQTGGQAGARPGAGGTPGQGQAAGGNAANRARPITGTVETFEAATKILTVKDAEGKSQKFNLGSATVTKSQKLSADEFGKLAGGTGIVLVTGDKGGDGVYNARSLTAIDVSGFTQGGGAGAAGGFPGGGAGGFGGAGGANAPVIVRGGTLATNKFSGSSFTGEPITANVGPDTALLKQGAGSTEDLKAGTAIVVTARAAQGDAPAEAQTVAIS